jgi:hypothetical protein
MTYSRCGALTRPRAPKGYYGEDFCGVFAGARGWHACLGGSDAPRKCLILQGAGRTYAGGNRIASSFLARG